MNIKFMGFLNTAVPCMVLSILPTVIWMCINLDNARMNDIWISYYFYSILVCSGDFNNIISVIRHIPTQAYVQISGEDLYWIMLDADKKDSCSE